MTKKKSRFINQKVAFILISILIGFLAGGLAILLAGYSPIEAYRLMLEGIFSNPRYMGWVVVLSTPIILTGLGFAFASRTGMFNIGGEGQYIIGTIVAVLVGTSLNLPKPLQVLVIFIIAMLAGFLWGGIAGFVKAKFGIHEVISTIMLNWIAFYLNNFFVNSDTFRNPNALASIDINANSRILLFPEAKKYMDGAIGKFFGAPVNLGIFIAILVAILVYVILNKTNFGYQLKAVGLNREAAEYAGISVNRMMVLSMGISGAICALAGSIQVMGYTRHIAQLGAMENFGFDGMAVALLAMNHPIGIIFSGFFFGALNYSGANIQRVLHAPTEMIQIIIGTIIIFTSMPLLFKILKSRWENRKGSRK